MSGASIVGQRYQQEDAWATVPDAVCQRKPCSAAVVFDGVGGHPNGGEAARAAAKDFTRALRQAMEPGDVLRQLAPAVLVSGGATTAVAVVLPKDGSDGFLASVGDSAAFALKENRLQRLVPVDRAPDGRITDWLGNADMRGHVVPFRLEVGEAVMLCSDGVDGVVSESEIVRVLQATDGPQALAKLMAAVESAGAPDNATAVWVKRMR